MIRSVIIVVVALGLSSCRDSARAVESDTLRMKEIVEEMIYFRDERTGLCFGAAYVEVGHGQASTGGPVVVHVPCEVVLPKPEAACPPVGP